MKWRNDGKVEERGPMGCQIGEEAGNGGGDRGGGGFFFIVLSGHSAVLFNKPPQTDSRNGQNGTS